MRVRATDQSERLARVTRTLAALPALQAKKKPEDRTKVRASTTEVGRRAGNPLKGQYLLLTNLPAGTDYLVKFREAKGA